jgi:outer membrane receptor protein involved in Fe transport
VVYAGGPLAGQNYTGTYLNGGTQIITNMSDMGSLVNDLSFSKVFKFDGSKLTANGGLFHMSQTIAQDWHPNSQFQSLDGSNPANLNLFTGANGTGQALTVNGVSGYNTAWGASVDRAYNINATNDAPYLNLNWEQGPLQLDAGLRQDYLHVSGWAESASGATSKLQTINGALVSTSTLDPKTYEALHYNASYNSYTLGALYLLTPNTSVFVRASQGGRFNVDRNILSGYTNADGSLTASGAQKVISQVKQEEIGAKTKGKYGSTSYGLNATLFFNTYGSSNFDLTQGSNGTYFDDKYKATGLELEGQLRNGGFSLVGNMTYTKAQIVSHATAPGGITPLVWTSSGVGNEPAYTPALTYMLAPSYAYGAFRGGLMFVGTGKMNMNNSSEYWAPGTTLVHMNLAWEFAPNATVSLNVHNMFNKLSAAGNAGAGSLAGLQGNPKVNGQYVSAISAVNGRSATVGVNYAF